MEVSNGSSTSLLMYKREKKTNYVFIVTVHHLQNPLAPGWNIYLKFIKYLAHSFNISIHSVAIASS